MRSNSGSDPQKEILAAVRALKQEQVLKIINTFEPTPLMVMLKKKGFQCWSHSIHHQYTETWFYREKEAAGPDASAVAASDDGWQEVRERFDYTTKVNLVFEPRWGHHLISEEGHQFLNS
ncbi:DUF2249 domain-containing protein [Cesiribacter sp. SM1]|uniref:DUF2249 domain-containing protein n=1 Tax=Cesiribacter sp. SM1 TaxID=2861196 RepID=UPI001CD2D798|nr:DUF2249 domain-containing protein [Cesiribacter sp. SM1]